MTTDETKNFFRVSAEDFKKIPGSPIAYCAKKNFFINLMQDELLGTKSCIKTGIARNGIAKLSVEENGRFMG